jgi:hypothetical protein
MTMNLYRFDLDCGRMGSIEGIFAAPSESVDNIILEDLYFGEMLGKHSDIECIIEHDHITLLLSGKKAKDNETIENIISLFSGSKDEFGHGTITIFGVNPFDYWEDDETDDYNEEE